MRRRQTFLAQPSVNNLAEIMIQISNHFRDHIGAIRYDLIARKYPVFLPSPQTKLNL